MPSMTARGVCGGAGRLRVLAGLIGLALIGPGAALAQPAPTSASTIDGPINPNKASWVRVPSNPEFALMYPSKAKAAHVTGIASIRCHVAPGGVLDSCVLVSESPADYGFGEAALAMNGLFRMAPAPFGPNASIQFSIKFNG